MHKIKMDTKPELIRLEAVDPSAVPGSNMYIKNEVLYHVDTPSHHIVKKDDPKVYYDHPHHHSSHHHHIQQETTKYIPDTVHNFQAKSMSQYPKYQTPKLRAKSTYSPMKSTTGGVMPSQQQIYMKHEPTADIMIEQIAEQQHLRQHTADHNTVQVITPNANYAGQQQQQHWNSDVTMTPIMEQQSMQSTAATEHNIAPDAIFIPESSSAGGGDNSSDYNSMNAPTINLIPLMTPNGLVFVAANQSTGTSTVISGMPSSSSGASTTSAHPSHHHLHNTAAVDTSIGIQQQNATSSRSYNRRKQPVAKRAAPSVPAPHVEIVSQEMAASGGGGGGGNASNLIYTQNGPLLLLNEQQHRGSSASTPQHHTSAAGSVAGTDYKPQQVTTTPLIPEKGTVIVEEPPKPIYQSRYGSDINENSTHYNSKNGVKSASGSNSGNSGYRNTSTNVVQSDAELDLDAAITVFKIYK